MKAAAPAFISHTPQRRLVWEPPTWDSLAIVVMSSPPHIAITLPDSRACWPIAFRPACNNFAPSHVCATRSTPRVGTVMRAPVHDQTPRNSFQVLAWEHLPCLYGLARRLTRHDPEDLVQDALLRGYRSYGTLRSADAGCGWLRAILVNAYRDRIRRDARTVDEIPLDDVADFSLYRTLAEEDPFPYSDSLHVDFLHAFGREDVREALLRLPAIYRAPLVLRYIQGFATKEIARAARATGGDGAGPAASRPQKRSNAS